MRDVAIRRRTGWGRWALWLFASLVLLGVARAQTLSPGEANGSTGGVSGGSAGTGADANPILEASATAGAGVGTALSDIFVDRQITSGVSGTASGSNRAATRDPGEPQLGGGGKRGGHSLWISLRAPTDGALKLSTYGSSFDTLIAVFRPKSLSTTKASSFGELELVAVGDDDDEGSLAARLTVGVRRGFEYVVLLDGYGGTTGDVVFSWEFVSRSVVSPIVTAVSASQSVGEGAAVSLWAQVNAPGRVEYQWFRGSKEIDNAKSETLTLPSFGRADVGRYRVRIQAEEVDVYSEWIELQMSSETAGGGSARDKLYDALEVPLRAELGEGERVVPGVTSPARTRRLLGNIGVVRGVSGSQVFSTVSGTRDPDEPVHCGVVGGASYWFNYQAAGDGTLHFDGRGSDFPALIAIYTYAPPLESFAQLVPITCGLSGPANAYPAVDFAVSKGGNYLVVLEGLAGARGTAQLNYQFTAAVPARPPTILGSLADRLVAEGDTLTLEAVVEGTAPLGYRWYRDGNRLAGIEGARLEVRGIGLAESGGYRFEVTNVVGAATSGVARITVVQAPSVSFAETRQRVLVGSNVRLIPRVSGGEPRQFRWLRGADPVPGATSSELLLNPVGLPDSGEYRVQVTDPLGRVAEASVVLEVVPIPRGAVLGPELPVAAGTPVQLDLAFEGAAILRVRWFRDGAEIPGASGTRLSFATVSVSDSGEYRALVDTEFGAVACLPRMLQVDEPVTWLSLPQGREVVFGDRVVLEARVSGTGPLVWQWFRADQALVGEVGPVLVLDPVTEAGLGEYWVSVSNRVSAVRSPAVAVTVATPPVVLSQPEPTRVGLTGRARFRVVVGGAPESAVRWLKDGVLLPESVATGPELVLSECDPSAAGMYEAEVSNRAGLARSVAVRLEVIERVSLRRDRSSGSLSLLVPVAPGRPFTVESAAALVGPWQGVASGLGNERGLFEIVGSGGADRLRVFRVRLAGQPASNP